MTIEIWLTCGLLFSAASQAALQGWAAIITKNAAEDEGERRLKEHNAEEILRRRADEAEQDVAFLEVWGESFRVESIASQWSRRDLIELSCMGMLDHLSVKPADPSALMRTAAKLSHESGYLVGMALTLANDTAYEIGLFNRNVNELIRIFKSKYAGAHAGEIVDGVKERGGEELDRRVEQIRKDVRDLALLLWDAARHSPRAEVNRRMAFHDDMQSLLGRQAATRLAERGKNTHASGYSEA